MAWSSSSRSGHVRSWTLQLSTTTTTTRTTQLYMGMFEDFLSGQDQSIRNQENTLYLQQLQTRVQNINALESIIEELNDDELIAKTQEFRLRIQQEQTNNNNDHRIDGTLLEEAFAVVREASW